MTRALKWWLALGLLVVFLAGSATGLVAGAWHARQAFAGRHGGMMADQMRAQMQRELALTPEQTREIQPILDTMAKRLQEIRRESGRRVFETMTETHREMVPHLTVAQQERLEAMKQRHLRRGHRRGHGPGAAATPTDE
ncbi:MAG: hypothetical protein ABI883_04985, partial [Chthoniobacterales bacterium]